MTRIRPDELSGIVLGVAQRLRSSGARIGTSEVIQAEKIVKDYMTLLRADWVSVEELAELLIALWPGVSGMREAVKEELERAVSSRSVERRARRIFEELVGSADVIGARPGDRVSLRRAMKGGRREKAKVKAAYLRLKRVGAIRGKHGQERLADKRMLRSIALSLARAGYESVDDAIQRGVPLRSRDDALLQMEAGLSISRSQLENLSERRLLRTGWDAIKKRDYKTQETVADILRQRIIRGEPVRDFQAVLEYLERVHRLTSDILINMLEKGEPVRGLSLDTIASIVASMSDEQAGRLLYKYRRILPPEDYVSLLSMTEPRKLWALSDHKVPGDQTGIFRAIGSAARALREAIIFAKTLDSGRADMSLYYADRAENLLEKGGLDDPRSDSVRALANAARRLVSLVEGSAGVTPSLLLEMVAGLELEDAVVVAKALYTRASAREEREMIVRGMVRVLDRLVARHGLVPLRRRVLSGSGGRLDIRRTLYGVIRYRPDPLIFVSKARSRPLALALDISGSMSSYSSWALAVSSVFSRHLERIVLFNHKTELYDGPFSRSDIARILLEAEFGGRTDISLALRVAGERLRSKRIVVVSDLSQTVDSDPPWVVAGELRKRGIKVIFITHEKHDTYIRKLLEAEQARIIVARGPRDAASRILHLIR